MKVQLNSITQPIVGNSDTEPMSPEEYLIYCARVSSEERINNETAPRLMKYLIKHKHWSPFEMISIGIEVKTSRAIAQQILRHRSFSFQEFCISGQSKITLVDSRNKNSKKVPIEDLYKRFRSTYWGRSGKVPMVRLFDDSTKLFKAVKIKEVFRTGTKKLLKVTLGNGKSITCTKDHKLFTNTGFSTVNDLSVDSFVGCNGVAVYQDKEWLALTKEEHRLKSTTESALSKLTVSYSKVVSIVEAGSAMTYDLEVDHDSHNYVADGIITHNSQRYAAVTDMEPVELRMKAETNRQSSIDKITDDKLQLKASDAVHHCNNIYHELIESGVATECARMVLPLTTQTTIVMHGTLRSWIHFFEQRCSEHAQKEIQDIAYAARSEISRVCPWTAEALGWEETEQEVVWAAKTSNSFDEYYTTEGVRPIIKFCATPSSAVLWEKEEDCEEFCKGWNSSSQKLTYGRGLKAHKIPKVDLSQRLA